MNQSLYDHSYGFPRDELRLVPVGPSPGRGGENQEPYDVVMSEFGSGSSSGCGPASGSGSRSGLNCAHR